MFAIKIIIIIFIFRIKSHNMEIVFAAKTIQLISDRRGSATTIEPINSRYKSTQFLDPRNFVLSASKANRVPPSDLFSRVCHGDSITRYRATFPPCASSPSSLGVPPEETHPSLYFFFLSYGRPPFRRARSRCRRSHDLRYFPPGHFPRSRAFRA